MKNWKIFKRTMRVMGKDIVPYFLGIFFMSTGWAAFTVMSSLLTKSVVDAAQAGDINKIPYIIAINIVGGIAALLIYRKAAIVYNVEAKKAHSALCKEVFYHEVRLPYTYYEENHSGEFMSKLSYDLEKTGSIYGSRLRRTVAPLLQVGVYLIPMVILSWQITLCLVAVNLVMLLINGLLIEPMRKASKELSATNARMTENLSNLLQGMEQTRMYKAGIQTRDAFLEQNRLYEKKSYKKMGYTAILESCSIGFEFLCSLAFLLLGVYFVQAGHTTLGSLTAIYSLYASFSFQFLQLGKYLPELVGCFVNAQNIFDFLEEKREPANWYEEDAKTIAVSDNVDESSKEEALAVEVSDLSFCYREDKKLLEGFSIQVQEGETVAITGASGSGKSTISKLLLSLYPMKGGDIRIFGKSYRDYPASFFRKLIAYVPQEPYLFRGTVRENIRLGNPGATDEQIEAAARIAYAHDFIQNLQDGYDTFVGERGNNLSGGQRQRVAIARAILKDAPILLLDEATSALDNESENYINMALKELKNRKTIIMIAHRPSTIALADRECHI